ncbi:MAG: transcription-repair coupling factor [Ruminococcus sp.]|nr:transcription-repair coupling factor [Ruminococcus sp.]
MQFFIQNALSLSAVQELQKSLAAGVSPISLSGIPHIHQAQLLAALAPDAPALVIVEDEPAAKRLCADINHMTGEQTALAFPSKEYALTHVEGFSRGYEHIRLGALTALMCGACRYLVASAEAALQPLPPKEFLKAATIPIQSGEDYSPEDLARQLIAIGYTRSEKVEGASQFSVRGAIFDIFPVHTDQPVRIEFWGDTADSISFFETDSQRRTEQIDEILIPPAQETLCEPTVLAERIEALAKSLRGKRAPVMKEQLLADAEHIRSGMLPGNIDKYFPLCFAKAATLFDYTTGTVFLPEHTASLEKMRGVLAQHMEDCKILLEDNVLCRGLDQYYLELAQFQNLLSARKQVYISNFLQGSDRVEYRQLLNIEALQTAPWGGEIRQLIEDLTLYCQQGYRTMVVAGTEKTLPILKSDLEESGIPCSIAEPDSICQPGCVLLMAGSLSGGGAFPENKTAVITQTKASAARRKPKKKRKKGEEIRALSDITAGDLVVHALHGIGRFAGIRKLELEGITKDYITIQYAGKDVLYVPVTQLDMVSRYIGARDETNVKLHKLSGGEWQRTRNHVKRAAKDMAAELIALYAKREKAEGFAFLPDDSLQHEFEERFPYVETDDQMQSINEIKHDMERIRPMDRLLCGDVGFGKTEVALRAAMKCVLSGKQCAILVPTTVLAWQHYQTALRRFEQLPVTVELLSRFRNNKQQTEILKKLKNGQIDIIVGTHRLISKDVKFRDLGLAIIDEEQRFGVAHKEKFKETFVGIDVLTLSATPIPRTLNMALSGIRDMSVLEEPPQDRYPVQSYVVEYTDGVIAQALRKELKRGGQVYYLHNRVETIAACADKIQKLVPDARIAYAHGQMSEEMMSDIWRQLVEHEIDILVCTTIIETGVDVPNANTLIIEDADRLGLSQLYQLRGRVGRSNRRAYAYFTFRREKVLTEIASKRLSAMREFTQFGSGFRIALRDLEIRGAGSILSGKQHGNMEAVGYDMYIRILNEAIAEEKGEPIQKAAECTVDLQIDAHIPEEYIESLAQRLEIYRRIAGVASPEDKLDLIDELIDRYGDPPKSMLGLIDTALLRNTASNLGISEISERRGTLFFYIEQPTQDQITALSAAYRGRIIFNAINRPYIGVKLGKGEKTMQLMEQVLFRMRDAESGRTGPDI